MVLALEGKRFEFHGQGVFASVDEHSKCDFCGSTGSEEFPVLTFVTEGKTGELIRVHAQMEICAADLRNLATQAEETVRNYVRQHDQQTRQP